jgi:hypothetical protein
MLSYAALARGDLADARLHEARLPDSATRWELLAQIDSAAGDDAGAQANFVRAADDAAVQRAVDRLAASRPSAAYRLERQYQRRLEASATHPDAVAESYWHLGLLATMQARRRPAERARWMAIGLRDYRRAVALAPLSEKYLLAAASQALYIRDLTTARQYFQRGVDVDPASADGYAGLAVVAQRTGDQSAARRYAQRSDALGGSPLLRDLVPQ